MQSIIELDLGPSLKYFPTMFGNGRVNIVEVIMLTKCDGLTDGLTVEW